MKFSDIMDYYYEGYDEPFNRWVDREFKLWRFPPWRVFDYLVLAVKQSIERSMYYGFPNFRSWHALRWTFRHALGQLARRD